MNDESTIRAEVERRKRRALDVGVARNVFRLFQGWLRGLNAGTDHRYYRLPDSVKNVVVCPRKWENAPHFIEVFLEDEHYQFEFVEMPPTPEWEHPKSWEDAQFGPRLTGGQLFLSKLGLRKGDDLLLEVQCKRTASTVASNYEYVETPLYVEQVLAFVEGPWVNRINDLAKRVFDTKDSTTTALQEQRKQGQLEEMKKRFGL